MPEDVVESSLCALKTRIRPALRPKPPKPSSRECNGLALILMVIPSIKAKEPNGMQKSLMNYCMQVRPISVLLRKKKSPHFAKPHATKAIPPYFKALGG